jgi:hypothetical protein
MLDQLQPQVISITKIQTNIINCHADEPSRFTIIDRELIEV